MYIKSMKPHLDRLPRTVELKRASDDSARFVYVDQRLLPDELVYAKTGDWREVVDAIKVLAVRGAPAIGVAGAAAVALWACNEGAEFVAEDDFAERSDRFQEALEEVCETIVAARPTAVNLAWAVERMKAVGKLEAGRLFVGDIMFDEVKRMELEDEAANRAIGANGAALLPPRAHILTHCNAGSLATVFFGTALGVVYEAAEQGKISRVYADETRPLGQGARLTVWELACAGVPVTLLCDSMAASVMAQGEIDAVIVGADRIAANGDVANKIGTLGVAILAQHYGIPVYVAAPSSTFDFTLATGADIPIEQRDPSEVISQEIEGVGVLNPAFDVTPAKLVSKIITEKGVFSPDEISKLLER